MSPLGEITDARFVSLQQDQPGKMPPDVELLDWSPELRDFAETAGLIANLDVVISVDTAVAHLAGAMGKKVYLLLPYVADWRWLRDRADSPWYPTMRLFRQPSAGGLANRHRPSRAGVEIRVPRRIKESQMAIWKQPTTYILCVLLCVGTFLRFDRITRGSLWVDEYWAVYLATGRGNLIFDIPLNRVIRSPPAANFIGRSALVAYLDGVGQRGASASLPLILRGWVDLLGDSDLATRGMSAVFGLAGIVLIFDLARSLHGKFAGIFAAGMMAFAPIQIDLSQETRPYTMLAFIGLLLWRSLILIEQKGLTRIRLLGVALGVAGLALTHYFSLGVIAAAAFVCGTPVAGRPAQVRPSGNRRQSNFHRRHLGAFRVGHPLINTSLVPISAKWASRWAPPRLTPHENSSPANRAIPRAKSCLHGRWPS